jgi:dTDP-4-dehydrorhamnose reductase
MSGLPKILVTGANGQLGMELRDLSSSFSQFEFVFASRQDLPIDDFTALQAFFDELKPQVCINCAAYTQVDAAETHKEEAFLINAEAVSVIADLCRGFETRLIHISTDYVFDGLAEQPYSEESPIEPVNTYGASKLAGENYALEMNPETIIIRTSWVYSSYGKNFVKTMLRLMAEKKQVSVVNDQLGSPTYAADLAECILQIITSNVKRETSNLRGIYHFSNEGVISWYDFAVAIKELTGRDCEVNPISTSQYPTPAKRPAYSVLGTKKIQETFGIRVKNWKESLAVCLRKIKERS